MFFSTHDFFFPFPFSTVLKEALNMRNAYAIYRTLAKFVEETDKAYSGEGEDPSIDNDFRLVESIPLLL